VVQRFVSKLYSYLQASTVEGARGQLVVEVEVEVEVEVGMPSPAASAVRAEAALVGIYMSLSRSAPLYPPNTNSCRPYMAQAWKYLGCSRVV
jgi:hypothetical protein